MQSGSIRIGLLTAFIVGCTSTARADAILLVGLMSADGLRTSVSIAFGHYPSIAGFEIEFVGTVGRANTDRSSSGGIFGNAVVRPVVISNLQFFALAGLGLYGQKFADGEGTGALSAVDIGGGVQIWITERVRMRVDYRVFMLGRDGSRVPSPRYPQRISGGLHLGF